MATTNKIQSLTPEQAAAMPEYVNKWVSIGLSTEPTDEEKGTMAIAKMYEIGGYKLPHVYWFDSPLEPILSSVGHYNQALRRARIQVYDQIHTMVRNRLREQVSDQVFDRVFSQVEDPVYYRVADNILDHMRGQIIVQAFNQMVDRLKVSVNSLVFSQIADIPQSHWYWGLPGGLNTADKNALYDFFANAMHLDIGYEKLAGIIGVAEEASIVYTFRDCAFAVRKMRKCSLDEQGRLHCEDGPAALFNDGFSLYAWHGVWLLGKEWIITDPERITAKVFQNESDLRVKRVMIERLAARGQSLARG
jgi:hypothetical protein